MRRHRHNPDSDEMRQAEAENRRAIQTARDRCPNCYGGGYITVNGRNYACPVCLGGERPFSDVQLAQIARIQAEDEAETIRRLAELRLFDPEQLAIIARMKTWKDEDCDPTP